MWQHETGWVLCQAPRTPTKKIKVAAVCRYRGSPFQTVLSYDSHVSVLLRIKASIVNLKPANKQLETGSLLLPGRKTQNFGLSTVARYQTLIKRHLWYESAAHHSIQNTTKDSRH